MGHDLFKYLYQSFIPKLGLKLGSSTFDRRFTSPHLSRSRCHMSLIDSFINLSHPFSPDLQNIITSKPKELESWNFQYVIFAHWMLCFPLGYVERVGGITSCDRLNSSENYLLQGFLLARPEQSVLLLVRQSITQDNCSISVSYPSYSDVAWLKNLLTQEINRKLWKRVELGQETIKSKTEGLHFMSIMKFHEEHLWNVNKKPKTRCLNSERQHPESISCFQQLTGRTPHRKST